MVLISEITAVTEEKRCSPDPGTMMVDILNWINLFSTVDCVFPYVV